MIGGSSTKPPSRSLDEGSFLYRTIDQHGQVIDVLVGKKRDLAATCRFVTRILEHRPGPSEVTTDRAPAYPRMVEEG